MRILSLLCFLFPLALSSQPSLFDVLHTRTDTSIFRIETNWNKLIRQKRDKIFQPATVVLTLGDKTYTFKGKLRSRGNIRLEVCQNPSLKLKLNKKELLAAGFSNLNELKFVLQCSNSKMGENYMLRERLVYDLHKVYSDFSHRTVPANFDFGDGEITHAFMVEHEEQLTARLNARVVETKRLSSSGLQRRAYVNMCLFNYLILNTDWHVANLHNLKFISPVGSLDLIPIPYDFDYSGFVGTHYAIPREELDISSIYTPKWLGRSVTAAEIKVAAAHFLAQREQATKLILEHPGLHKRDLKRMTKRLDEFYELIENEKQLVKLVKKG